MDKHGLNIYPKYILLPFNKQVKSKAMAKCKNNGGERSEWTETGENVQVCKYHAGIMVLRPNASRTAMQFSNAQLTRKGTKCA